MLVNSVALLTGVSFHRLVIRDYVIVVAVKMKVRPKLCDGRTMSRDKRQPISIRTCRIIAENLSLHSDIFVLFRVVV